MAPKTPEDQIWDSIVTPSTMIVEVPERAQKWVWRPVDLPDQFNGQELNKEVLSHLSRNQQKRIRKFIKRTNKHPNAKL
jgi:hypothetical protein